VAVAGAQGLLTDQFPAYEVARALEEILECGAECRLVLDVPGAVPLKRACAIAGGNEAFSPRAATVQ